MNLYIKNISINWTKRYSFELAIILIVFSPLIAIGQPGGGGGCSGINDFFLQGTSTVCNGGATELYVNNSQLNVQYQLQTSSGTDIGSNKWGNGGQLTFGNHGVGSYRVEAKQGGCYQNSVNTKTISNTTLNASMSLSGAPEYCPHETTTLTASPTGTYQWYRNNVSISGATSQTYSITQAGTYKVKVTVGICSDESSSLNIIAADVATPSVSIRVKTGSNLSICPGESITFETYNVQDGGTPSFQWKKNGQNVGSNSTEYSSSSFSDNDVITCVMTTSLTYCVSNSTDTSNALTVDIRPLPNPFLLSGAGTVCNGGTRQLFINGSESGVSYQLQTTSGTNIGNAKNGNGGILSLDNHGVGTYQVRATKSGCVRNSSNTQTITNTTVTAGMSLSGSPEYCPYETTTLTASPTGSYQWYRNDVQISGQSYQTLSVTQAGTYKVRVTVNGCADESSSMNIIAANVASPSVSIREKAGSSLIICPGGSITFETYNVQDGGTPSFQWKKNGVNVGTNSPEYTSNSFNDQDEITCIMTTSLSYCVSNPADTSNVLSVTVRPLPEISLVTGGGAYCGGGAGKPVGVDYGHSGVSYTLFRDQVTQVGAPEPGQNQPITFGNQTIAGEYTVIAEKNGCTLEMQGSAVISIDQASNAGTIAGFDEHCGTQSTGYALNGYNGTIKKWEYRFKNGTENWQNNWVTIIEEDSVSAVNPTLEQSTDEQRTYQIKATVKSGVCTESTTIKEVTVDPLTVAGTITGSDEHCGSSSTQYSIDNHVGTVMSWEYRYKNGSANWGSWEFVSEVPDDLSVSPTLSEWTGGIRTYELKATIKSGICNPLEAIKTITVYPLTDGGTIQGASNHCGTSSTSYQLNGSEGTIEKWEYRFKNGNQSWQDWVSITEDPGITSVSPTLSEWSSGQRTYEIRAKVKSGICTAEYPDIQVTVDFQPVVDAGPDVEMFQSTETLTLTGQSPSGGSWSDVNSATSGNTFDAAIAGVGNHILTYNLTSAPGCFDEDTRTMTVLNDPVMSHTGTNGLSIGESVLVSVSTGFINYQWKSNGVDIIGETGNTYTISELGSYSVSLTSTNGTPWSSDDVTFVKQLASDENYIMTWDFKKAAIDPDNIPDDHNQVNRTIQYFDGLGRPSQVVQWQASPLGFDLIQPFDYDKYGRELYEYLPYTGGIGGLLETDFLGAEDPDYSTSSQYLFYNSTNNVAEDNSPFARKILEQSQLTRILKQGAPGTTWQPNPDPAVDTDKVVRFSYKTNVLDEVPLWTINASDEPEPLTSYVANELRKNVTRDEEGNQVIEYVDKSGQTVLKKVETGDATNPWAETHYVYDDFNNLRFVLPPMIFEGNSTLDAGELEDFAFQYKYDDQQRMVEKKVPGAGWVYMVYDERDRLVLTQDANQRENNEWIFTKYDALNRPVSTGMYTNSLDTTRTDVQNLVDTQIGSTFEWFESRKSTSGNVHGYDNLSFPDISAEIDYLTVTYYDDYSWNTDANFNYDNPTLSHDFNGVTYNSVASAYTAIKGQVTGGLIKNLASNAWLKSITYYDDRYRVIQTIANNNINGIDITSNLYDFSGKVLQTNSMYDDGPDTINILRTFDYDHADRLLTVRHKIDNHQEVILVQNDYNELGEVIEKDLHIVNGSQPAQSIDYRYNIRGWLRSINESGLSGSSEALDPMDLFNMELIYNTTVNGLPTN